MQRGNTKESKKAYRRVAYKLEKDAIPGQRLYRDICLEINEK